MSQADTVGAVHVEGLSLRVGTAAGGGVSQVANTHGTGQISDSGTVLEDTSGDAVGLELVDATPGCASCDTCGILTAICSR